MSDESRDLTRFLLIASAVAAVGVVCLIVLWYAKHPDRSPFVDFAPRVPTHPQTNGAGPLAPAPAHPDGVAVAEGSTEPE